MGKKFSTLLRVVLFLIAFIAIERFCYYQTGGFSPRKIVAEFPGTPISEESEQEILELLAQPFYYLDKGVQFYAFISEDETTILKLVKQKHSRPADWVRAHQKIDKRRKKIFSSCELAYRELRRETGLISLHLYPEAGREIPVTLYDNLGIAHEIDLNKTSFALQKKADLLEEKFTAWHKAKEKEKIKKGIDSLIELIAERCYKNISNLDARTRNFAFIEERPIEIDLGSFVRETELSLEEEIEKETLELRKWIAAHEPELNDFLSQKIEAVQKNSKIAMNSSHSLKEMDR
jgi:hypothetical protein